MSELSGRILAIDLGKKRVGLAISDPFGHFAVGLETLEIKDLGDVLRHVETLRAQYEITKVVVGLPRKMAGGEGLEAENARKLKALLEKKFGWNVDLFDERFTSVLAQQTLREQGIKASKNKGLIDQAAAKRILQDYLDSGAR